ncbi:uracil-DNA glycosylase [Halofilum ochraceum]|uniref:uracil-DNA glycosylase n=1 Tax=Halofilum ochraceum TaxID=1611323 RepID=UPI0008359570|nr:uracil-DNA glycosylase [Halofilum ochraceum]
MDEATRRAYLEAMGVTVWVPRGSRTTSPDVETVGDDTLAEVPAPDPAAAESAAAPASMPEDREAAVTTADHAVSGTDVASMDGETLRQTILGCTACGLCETRTQAVPGVGSLTADLLVIGEAPGQEEDRRGEPFVGRAGQLLDRMLAAIGLDRQTVYITNVLKCRPPNNRDPKVDEVQACAGYLRRQIELIDPKVILSVGRISAQSLLETDQTIGRLRERWHRFGPNGTPLRVTYHPAYLLRSPGQKRKSWEDLKAVRALLAD